MAFSKKAHLLTNTEAIRIAFALDREKRKATETERSILQQYSGFGGLKCILNPTQSEKDKAYWTKSELELFPLVADLHQLIRDNSKDEKEYKRYVGSLKNSVLTAFYTPPEIIHAISGTLGESGITSARFLDPSAGNGAFADGFRTTFPNLQSTCFEKDLLTGKVLSHLQPENTVHIKGFEEIEDRPESRFDIISSNIPFGDVSVFDVSFLKSKDNVKRQSTRSIHNYFFLKSVEHLREGGIVAFITSQGVLNSSQNEPVRHWLMQNTRLVSAVRLPNNLFTDHAGTAVGSDLIILQKNSTKALLSPEEQLFIQSRTLSDGQKINNLFRNFDRVIHTKASAGTDLYGKPATVFIHEGGIFEIANDLRKMFAADFEKRFDKNLYEENMIVEPNVKQYWHQETSSGTLIQKPSFFELHDATVYQLSDKEISELHFDNYMSEDFLETAEPDWAAFTTVESREKQEEKESIHREPLSSLYDLFGFSEQERRQENKPKNNKKKVQRKHPAQPNLFAQPANTGIQETQTEIQQDILNINTGQENTFSVEPRPYSSSLQDFYKSGSLVMDNGQIGFLKERYQGDAVFMPLALNPQQAQKANLYIQFRDTYHLLYNYEATEKRCKGWKIIFSYFSARCKPYIYRAYTLH